VWTRAPGSIPAGVSRYVHVRLPRPRAQRAPTSGGCRSSSRPGRTAGPPAFVPLEQIATITASEGPAQIDRYQRQRVVTVGANVEGRSLGERLAGRHAPDPADPLPRRLRDLAGRPDREPERGVRHIFIALGIAVVLMYLILVVQFGSFLDPLAILVSLPLSLIGVVLALLVTGDTLNLMSLIGVICSWASSRRTRSC
jgi:HAE1 family hydrophobic/amphiphilic exporter-1